MITLKFLDAIEILEDAQHRLIDEEFDEYASNVRLLYKLTILEDAKDQLRD